MGNPFYKPVRVDVEIPAVSSNLNPRYSRTRRMATIPADDGHIEPINRIAWSDYLDPAVNEGIFDSIRTVQSIKYTGTPLTTIADAVYGTTTLWWVILQYNGYLHPDEIPNGAQLLIPSAAEVQAAFIKSQEKGRGKIVTLAL